MKYQPNQSIVDYNDWDLATSSVITGDFTTDSLKYGFGPTSLSAEDWLPEGNWVDLGYDNAPTEDQLRSQIEAGEHNDAYGDLGCPDCGNVDLFWKTHSSKGQRYRCLSCEYSSNWETVKSQGDLTLQKFGLTVDCPLCSETISAYNRASIDSHFRKHKKEEAEAAEAPEPKVSESEWQEEVEWNDKPKKKTEPEWEDVEWESEQPRKCCECNTTEGLTTIQAGTFCWNCLPINLGAEDDYWAGSVAKAIVNEMGDDYYFNEDLHEYNCVHFAQEMSGYLTQDGIPHEIQSFAGYGGEVAHAWVYVPSEGEYYDAWTPYGVSDWKDLGFWETVDYTPEWLEQQTPESFEAEDNYDSTYGKAQAKIRRKLKNKIKQQAIMGTKAGQWSARKSQELKRQYETACQKKGLQPYKGSKTKKQQDLSDWSKQKWKTASGKKSSITGEPYFPAKAVAALKQKNLYAKAKRQKAAATKAGKQNARYSDDIRAVVKQFRAEESGSPTPTQLLNWLSQPKTITTEKPFEDWEIEPTRCIWCGSGDIDSETPEHQEEGLIYSYVGCKDCGCIWREEYRYVDNEIIEEGEKRILKSEDEQLQIEIEDIDETYGLIPSDPEMLSLAESAVSQYLSRTDLPETFQLHTNPHFVFVSADAFGRSSHVARFRSHTSSHIPIIMLSSDAIRESADDYGVSLKTAVETTVWHELGHVLCELWDMEEIYPFESSNDEEEFAESIAESMYFQESFKNPVV
ncbi:hypothetical protein N9M03_00110 [bacterium]|nr:hypothetical protein [bacterium]